MRVFKNTWFDRFAEKEDITDNDLKEAVKLLEADQADADLGGGVYKVRVARSGGGKQEATESSCFSEAKSVYFLFMVLRSPIKVI